MIEGMSDSICDGVELTFVGAKVNCPACNSIGTILACGPRFPDNWMGNQLGLENDLCGCKCYPQPVMQASQAAMFESYGPNELVSMGFTEDGIAATFRPVADYWVRFTSTEVGDLYGIRCAAHFGDGTVEHGVFDENNTAHFDRENASVCKKVEILFDSIEPSQASIVGSLLAAMEG